jgi:predicted GIY-YIG superfamily endonuclease
MYYTYKIREKKTDKVVYIGETKQPWKRWRSHVEKYGAFNRIEHYMDVLDEYVFDNRNDALAFEGELKKQHGFQWTEEKRLLKRNSIPVVVFCNNTGKFIGEFISIADASKKLNIHREAAGMVVNGKRNQTGGYIIKNKN